MIKLLVLKSIPLRAECLSWKKQLWCSKHIKLFQFSFFKSAENSDWNSGWCILSKRPDRCGEPRKRLVTNEQWHCCEWECSHSAQAKSDLQLQVCLCVGASSVIEAWCSTHIESRVFVHTGCRTRSCIHIEKLDINPLILALSHSQQRIACLPFARCCACVSRTQHLAWCVFDRQNLRFQQHKKALKEISIASCLKISNGNKFTSKAGTTARSSVPCKFDNPLWDEGNNFARRKSWLTLETPWWSMSTKPSHTSHSESTRSRLSSLLLVILPVVVLCRVYFTLQIWKQSKELRLRQEEEVRQKDEDFSLRSFVLFLSFCSHCDVQSRQKRSRQGWQLLLERIFFHGQSRVQGNCNCRK